MSKTFYTNVQVRGNKIFYRGIEDGIHVQGKFDYCPRLYEKTNEVTEYRTLEGEYLHEFQFDDILTAKAYVESMKEVDDKKIYGNQKFEYNFINDNFPDEVNWDSTYIHTVYLDIECKSDDGFPDPEIADQEITAISIKYSNGPMIVFGCGDYEIEGDEKYIKCSSEYNLLERFMKLWTGKYPDVFTGWNVGGFDAPYLYNRITNLLGESVSRKLSPWGMITTRDTVDKIGRPLKQYTFLGIAILDYPELYRKFAPGGASQESYSLDNIASVELGTGKIAYDEYDNLRQLYKNDYQKFIRYNIMDTNLVEQLEDKLKLIELAFTLSYQSKTNYVDVFSQVRMWDILMTNYLAKDNIIVPPTEEREKNEAFIGAAVKEPQVGMHESIVSFDLTSLYPHLILQFNISPETIVDAKDYDDEMRKVISAGINVDKLLTKSIDLSNVKDYAVTPNGQFFRKDKKGFLAEMMQSMFDDRKKYKKLYIQAKKDYEATDDESKKKELETTIARYNNLQLAIKVCLNSAYGALGNQYHRFFDVRQAMAITTSGQLAIRWIQFKMNEYMNNILNTENGDYIIASDTDSIYLRLAELIDKFSGGKEVPVLKRIDIMDKICEEKLQPFIDKSYKELADYVNAYEQKMLMKREVLVSRGLWTAKKRYVLDVYDNEGVRYKEPEIKIVGLEMVRSSTPKLVREKMKEMIKILLRGTQEEMHSFIKTFKKEFNGLQLEEICSPTSVNGLTKYQSSVTIYVKATPAHVKGSLIYNHLVRSMNLENECEIIKEGEKVKYVFLKEINPIKEKVIAFPTRLPKQLNLHKYIDYNRQFEKVFLDPVERILQAAGWSSEVKSTLDSFFQ